MAVARADDRREMRTRRGTRDADAACVVAVLARLRAQVADRRLDLVHLAGERRLRGGAEVEARHGEAALDERGERHGGLVAVFPGTAMNPNDERRARGVGQIKIEPQWLAAGGGRVLEVGLNRRCRCRDRQARPLRGSQTRATGNSVEFIAVFSSPCSRKLYGMRATPRAARTGRSVRRAMHNANGHMTTLPVIGDRLWLYSPAA